MKIKDLIKEIRKCQKEYPDFLEWDIYTEQMYAEGKNNDNYKFVTDSDEWIYYKCQDTGWTKFTKEKIFTFNVNY